MKNKTMFYFVYFFHEKILFFIVEEKRKGTQHEIEILEHLEESLGIEILLLLSHLQFIHLAWKYRISSVMN